jgi:transcription elongation factor GreB
MSKAFVKEDDSRVDSAPEIEFDARADIPPGAKNYMTPKGARKLRSELEVLLNENRPRLLERVNRSDPLEREPAVDEIREARKQLRKIDRRIDFLIKRLELTEIVDPSQVLSNRVKFGASVRLQHEDGSITDYQIVGIDETDLRRGRISWTSPLAKAILDTKAGDVITFKSPAHEEEVEILSVRYEDIS